MKMVAFNMGKVNPFPPWKSTSCKRLFLVWWFWQKNKKWNIKL